MARETKEPVQPEVVEPYELDQNIAPRAHLLRASPGPVGGGPNPNVDRIIAQKMDLLHGPVEDYLYKRAEVFHQRYRANRSERKARLKELHADLGHPNDVIVVLCCRKFFPLFENWLASCAKHGIEVRDRLIAFTLDQEAATRSAELGVANYFLDPDIYEKAGGSITFADEPFSATMFYKNAVVLDCVKIGCNVLSQDVDLIWLKNPFDYLAQYCSGRDISIMYDGENRHHRPLYANTGFFYVKCNDACRALLETALRNTASIFKLKSHQAPFNRIIAHFHLHNILNVHVLPQNRFLNGHLFKLERGVHENAGNWRENGIVVHYSWTRDTDHKKLIMEKFGFNILPE